MFLAIEIDSLGLFFALLGAALVATFGGIGSAQGVQIAGKAAAGVTSEKPEFFGRMLILQALPGTQGIYGFVIAIMVLIQTRVLSTAGPATLTAAQGLMFLGACLPGIVVLPISAYFQAKMSAASILMVAKQPDALGKGITFTAVVETYAILALLACILMITNIKLA